MDVSELVGRKDVLHDGQLMREHAGVSIGFVKVSVGEADCQPERLLNSSNANTNGTLLSWRESNLLISVSQTRQILSQSH
jgi:hypothetical protein